MRRLLDPEARLLPVRDFVHQQTERMRIGGGPLLLEPTPGQLGQEVIVAAGQVAGELPKRLVVPEVAVRPGEVREEDALVDSPMLDRLDTRDHRMLAEQIGDPGRARALQPEDKHRPRLIPNHEAIAHLEGSWSSFRPADGCSRRPLDVEARTSLVYPAVRRRGKHGAA
jgi:hypothetical protein